MIMTRVFWGIVAMAGIVLASNILVQFLLLDGLLTWGAFTYPFAFLVTDIMNRLYGPAQARRVVLAGLVTGIFCSLIGSQIDLQGDGFTYPAVALRVGVASACAFLVAQLLDIAIFNRLRDGNWWRAPVVSSLVASTIDTIIFFTIAFSASIRFGADSDAEVSWAWDTSALLLIGGDAPLWVSLAIADWGVKIAIALIALVPFRLIVGRLLADRSPS
jgi:uncharacterized integral membrane protein (TIGR00697 family)